MTKGTLLVGEPMGLFIAQQTGPLEDVDGYSMALAGAEFNVAVGLRRLGHPVGYLTKLGTDPFGKRVLRMMAQSGISTELISFSQDRTTGFMLKSRVEEGNPEIFYYRKHSAASTLSPEDVLNLDFSRYGALHLTGITPALSDSTRAATEALWQKARENAMTFSFDPNLRPQLWPDKATMVDYINGMAARSDLFLPGVEEASLLLGTDVPERIAEFYQRSGTGTVVVKLGDRGAYYATPRESGYVDAFPVETIVDTVGAGDGFAAGVLSALQEGLPIAEAVRRGNGVGAIQVMSRGDNDGLPTREELDAFMAGERKWRKQHD